MKNFKKLLAFSRLVKPFANAHSCGFTLAEVLITLSILGVVAAITVPSLIDRQNEKEFVTKLKKEYAALTNAYDIAQAEDGTDPSGWYNKEPISEKIGRYLDYTKVCTGSANGGCFPDTQYKNLQGSSNDLISLNRHSSEGAVRYVMKDGSFIKFLQNKNVAAERNCTSNYGTTNELKRTCGSITIDVNGNKGPNRVGYDTFAFTITAHTIVPKGIKEDTDSSISGRCNKNSTDAYNGYGCAAWVVYKGNMDYKRKAISWD